MSARKFAVLLDESQAGRARSSAPPDEEVDHVLGEIRHELGNYFHKLYYFADVLNERAATAEARAPDPGALLEPTLRSLEGFLQSAFAHFSPMSLDPVSLSVGDLATAVALQVTGRAVLRGLRVVQGDLESTRGMRADLGLLSAVAQVVSERVDARSADRACVTVSLDDKARDAVSVTVLVEPARPAPPLLQRIESVLRWARAQQTVELHGGELGELYQAGAYAIRLSLPAERY